MSVYLEKYASMGLSNIIILSSKWKEEVGGYQDEHTTEELICVKNEKYYKMNFYWTYKVWKGESYKSSEEEISEEEYSRLKNNMKK